jgi:hypothetical protein
MATKFDDTYEFPDEVEAKKAAAEEKFEIEIEDDTPPADRGRKPMREPVEDPTDEELATYDEKVQARMKKFTRGYHDERRAKEQAVREREATETYAKQIIEENKRLQQQLSSGSKVLIEQSQSSAQLELDAAKKKYKEAYETADVDALADSQAEIAKATLRMDRASGMKPIEVDELGYAPAQQQKSNVTPRTQKWLDRNEWFGPDDEMTMTAMGIDRRLQKEYGADYVGTEEYFQTIDKTMRKRFPEHFESDQSYEEDESPPKKRTSEPDEDEPPRRATRITSPVAPAARSTPPNRIRLKASEVETARRLQVPIEEYAKQVALLRRGA